MRHLADYLVEEEMRVYAELGIDIPYRWHSILQIFRDYKRFLSVTELAEIQNKTHPDVVYTINQMVQKDLIIEQNDRHDKRKRLVGPSESAKDLISVLEKSWHSAEEATNKWLSEVSPELWLNIDSLENSLSQKSFYSRIKKEKKQSDLRSVSINTFNGLPDADIRLQNFWAQFKTKYFNVPELSKYLDNARHLINKGEAEVFFAKLNNEIEGCIFLLRRSFTYCEIIFIWVNELHRRKYIATKLLTHTLTEAGRMGAKSVFVQLSHKLVALNALYYQHGFTTLDQLPKSGEEYLGLNIKLLKEVN